MVNQSKANSIDIILSARFRERTDMIIHSSHSYLELPPMYGLTPLKLRLYKNIIVRYYDFGYRGQYTCINFDALLKLSNIFSIHSYYYYLYIKYKIPIEYI